MGRSALLACVWIESCIMKMVRMEGLCEVWRVAWPWWALVIREGLERRVSKKWG